MNVDMAVVMRAARHGWALDGMLGSYLRMWRLNRRGDMLVIHLDLRGRARWVR